MGRDVSHEDLVQALLDPRVRLEYAATVPEQLLRTADMAALLDPPMSRKDLLNLAQSYPSLRACARPLPQDVPRGRRPRLKWVPSLTRAWYAGYLARSA